MMTEAYSRERHKAEFHRRRMGNEPLHELRLHTAMPTFATEHELTAPGYKKKTVARTDGPGGGWVIAKNGEVSNRRPIVFLMKSAKEKSIVKYLSVSVEGNLQRVVKIGDAGIAITQDPGQEQEIRFEVGALSFADETISAAAAADEGEKSYAKATSVYVPPGEN